jgi:hypothetical protein
MVRPASNSIPQRIINNRQEFEKNEAELRKKGIATVPADTPTKQAFNERRRLSIAFPPPESNGSRNDLQSSG